VASTIRKRKLHELGRLLLGEPCAARSGQAIRLTLGDTAMATDWSACVTAANRKR